MVIRRENYPLPTAYPLMPKIKDAVISSKLIIRDAHSIQFNYNTNQNCTQIHGTSQHTILKASGITKYLKTNCLCVDILIPGTRIMIPKILRNRVLAVARMMDTCKWWPLYQD